MPGLRTRGFCDRTTAFLAVLTGEAMMVPTADDARSVLAFAQRRRIPVATFKLPGHGWGILKLKRRVLARCPECGYKRPGNGEKWWQKAQ